MILSTRIRKWAAAILCGAMVLSINANAGIGMVSAESSSAGYATSGDSSYENAPLAAGEDYTAFQDEAEVSEEILSDGEETEGFIPSDYSTNFIVIESARFDTPASEKYVVVDMGDGSEAISDAELVILNETTREEITFPVDTILDTSFLFYMTFSDEESAGKYKVTGVRYSANGDWYEKLFSDEDMAPRFGVNMDINEEPDAWLEETADRADALEDGADVLDVQEKGVLDISDSFENANAIGINGENGDVTITGDESAFLSRDSFDVNDYIYSDEDFQEVVADTVDRITKSINTVDMLTASDKTIVASKAPANIVIVLDPGHGGSDTGAPYTWDGVQYLERDINQKIANACKAELDKYQNITVYLTRQNATDPLNGSVGDDLQWRCDYAHSLGADLFVSLHCNSSVTVNARSGAEVFVPNSSLNTQAYNVGKTVGTSIGKKLAALGLKNGATYSRSSENGSKYDDGSIADYYAVIRHCKEYGIPAMIVEHAYVNNKEDCTTYFASDEKIKALGVADAQGIAENIGLLDQNRIDSDMKMKGWMKSGSSWIYYDEKGEVKTGFFNVKGKTYYGKSNGVILTGWQLIEGNWYCFENDGVMKQLEWVKNSNNQWVYLKEDGKMATGIVDTGKKWYYFSKDGAMLTGWQKSGNDWYYMNAAGEMYRNAWLNSSGTWYYFGDKGKMSTGMAAIGKATYFFKDTGAMATDWVSKDGKWYYANSSGELVKSTWKKVGSSWYYFGTNYMMSTGWEIISGKRYYLNTSGELCTGWVAVGSDWYCTDGDGACYTNCWKKMDGVWYYFKDDGKMAAGWSTIGGKRYFMNASGAMQSGWFTSDKNWHLSDTDGACYTETWKKVGGFWYYFDKNSKMVTGWNTIDGQKYYMSQTGEMLNDWFSINKDWYKADANGVCFINSWYSENDNWYYFDKDGKMVTGINKIGNDKYFFVSSGVMQNGWIKSGSDWYYAKRTGELIIKNWLEDGGKKYYFDDNGKMVTTKIVIGEKTYYFKADGSFEKEVNNKVSSEAEQLYTIMGTSTYTAQQLSKRFMSQGKAYPVEALTKGGAKDIGTFCQIIVEEAKAEGVKPEVVFAQIMNETGWLQFGGDVKIEQFNFCGLGATGGGECGLSFADVRTGIRAQVQHLKAYASKDALKNECVDPRFKYVERGCAAYVQYLGIQENPSNKGWAANSGYGTLLLNIVYSIKQ